ncbi:multidrug effflux MFS transporter [Cryobacterium arcticum]|uniref:multidrug effflux MFS transporter n=1 Tax=Cryobacterium arcticum TaxID=670052 RepID=UPI0015E86266|nr:multidrug effflux MFS transporter [Cryobacterium arcticum]
MTQSRGAAPVAVSVRRIALIAAVLTWLGPFTIDTYSPSLPAIVVAFDAKPSLVQLTLTSALVGLVIGQLVIGLVSDRVGRRMPILVSLCLFLLACVACVLAPSIPVLIAARFVQGLTASAGVSMARAIGRDVFDGGELAAFYSRLAAATAVAPVVGPVLAGVLLEVTGTWRSIFVMIAALGVVAFVLVRFALPETHSPAVRSTHRQDPTTLPTVRVLRQRTIVVSAVLMACVSGMILSYLAGTSFLLQNRFGLSPAAYSAIFAVNAVGLVVFSRANARFVLRWHPAAIATVGISIMLAMGASLAVAFLLGAPVWVLLPMFFVLLSAYGIVNPNVIAMGMGVDRSQAGAAAATLGVAQYSLGALTAPLIGFAVAGPLPTMVYAICGYGIVALTVALVEGPRLRRVVSWQPGPVLRR